MSADDNNPLARELRRAGFSLAAIRAAWPSWWSPEADQSPSARAELRFALARRLGLAPKPLLGERVEFVWNDEAKFKHLSTHDAAQRAALTSFGVSVGRTLLKATASRQPLLKISALDLRHAILRTNEFVDLTNLVGTCWALGIPVIHLRVFPLEAKAMHAMVVTIDGRCAILLGRDAGYPAPVAFTLAHELGHIFQGHLGEAPALIDLEDPAFARDADQQEEEADHFALELLTGSSNLEIVTSLETFNAPTLADAALRAAVQYGVEPGSLAMSVGYSRRIWPIAMSALNFIYAERKPVWKEVNGIADHQLDWDSLGDDAEHYIRNVMFGPDV